jgi:hypothetical protein
MRFGRLFIDLGNQYLAVSAAAFAASTEVPNRHSP